MKYIIGFALSILCLNATAQDKFELTLIFPQDFDTRNMWVAYDNGLERKGLEVSFADGKATAKGEHFSKYATVSVGDERENILKSRDFWVSGNSEIQFLTDKRGFLIVDSLFNATNLKLLAKNNGFETTEYENYTNFSDKYLTDSFSGEFTDSLRLALDNLIFQLQTKELKLIQESTNNYFSFEHFRRNASFYALHIAADTLIKTFRKFPLKFRADTVGQNLSQYLIGLSLKKGSKVPLFSSIDAFSKEHLSNKGSKKEDILLVFWASWCKPCIEELPQVKSFINAYQNRQLKPVFITLDEDFTKFEEAVNKYELSAFGHIFSDKKIGKQFGINGVPEIYLINENNKVTYRMSGLNDDNLNQLLTLRPTD
jgi:thiol-disulfide isomerase/thioredoxin